LFDGSGSPLRRLVAVTVVAGVRRTERYGEIGPRNAEGVIVAQIDDHIVAGLHVARDTGGLRSDAGVMTMLRIGVFFGLMALQADALA
jgi:hypothetical protein